MDVDVLIFGGGIAGLWTLDELHRRGFRVVLAEVAALGAGQTVASQGIIHGGIKYSLSGLLSDSASAIRDMPGRWRAALVGEAEPKLAGTKTLSPCCFLWGVGSAKSRVAVTLARHGLRTAVMSVGSDARPEALAGLHVPVFQVDEQVLDVVSLLADLSGRHCGRLVKISEPAMVNVDRGGDGRVRAVEVAAGGRLEVRPRWVALCAGGGNAGLRERLGLSGSVMQRRPLHMVMARGELPWLFGHCIDAGTPRATVTSARDSQGRTVWQIGGKLAEDGVNLDGPALIEAAKQEMTTILPGVDFSRVEWATYAIDRAEGRTAMGRRPAGPVVKREANVLTAWPTKLALAPVLAEMVCGAAGEAKIGGLAEPAREWPVPEVARPPWEVATEWLG